jgi:hypothetical protein
MKRLSFGVLLIALATLVLELMLTRVFDVVLLPNISYFVVTAAVFAFGLAGIFVTLRPIPAAKDIGPILFRCSVAFAVATALLIPIVNALQLDYTAIVKHPVVVIASFLALYVSLLTPFFLAGYILIAIFSRYTAYIQRLYFWDLAGAGLGSILVVPFILAIGPGGLMICAAALAMLAAAMFSQTRIKTWSAVAVAALAVAVPVLNMPNYIDFVQHMDKRNLKEDLQAGFGEVVRWDPISKINVVNKIWTPEKSEPWWPSGNHKEIQYDGGNQTSHFYPFDGDIARLRAHLDTDMSHVKEHFWQIALSEARFRPERVDHRQRRRTGDHGGARLRRQARRCGGIGADSGQPGDAGVLRLHRRYISQSCGACAGGRRPKLPAPLSPPVRHHSDVQQCHQLQHCPGHGRSVTGLSSNCRSL